jgi:D-serine deaminase-like pyridoxal phosphate-dependent protein
MQSAWRRAACRRPATAPRGCDLKLIVDSVAAAQADAAFGREQGEAFEVWIEIDTDGPRSGVAPKMRRCCWPLAARCTTAACAWVVCSRMPAPATSWTRPRRCRLAERERAGCVQAAEALRAAGLRCPVVSVGSTPTALAACRLDGVTECAQASMCSSTW